MAAQPNAATLLDAVVRCLRDEALPQLQGRTAFNLRVSINALLTVARELDLGAATDQRELAGLRALLGRDGSLDGLREQLCDALARRDPALDRTAALVHLRDTAIGRLAIDQPSYSAYLAAVAPEGGAAPTDTKETA